MAMACGGDSPGDPGSSLNLRIDAMYVVQSTQTREGDVPLVAGKDGELRVFAIASASNTVTPQVRVRFYKAGVLQQTMNLPAGGASVPTTVDLSTLT